VADGVEVLRTVAEARARSEAWRCEGLSVGLVPTMGALHEGHLSLVRRAREECDRTVVSIFVNPLQFAPGEDSRARVAGLDEVLEGECRPGHFEGVATVVLKLFNAVRPRRAYFGQKDGQQARLVGRLARDLDTGVEVVVCATVREPDGLALSSRNAYLRGPERAAARCLVRALTAANARWLGGERDAAALARAMREVLAAEPLASVDYAAVVDEQSFRGPGRLAVVAVRIGRTRLIDNHPLGEPLPV